MQNGTLLIKMKTRLLMIIGIVLASVVISSVYVISVQDRCETILGDTHYPRPLNLWNCLDYLNMVDNPPPKSSAVIPEPEPNPIPEEYNDEFVTKQDHYISPFEEWIHEFQENYHTVITGKVIEWYGQKQPSKYDYQYSVEALAHHTPRMQEESIYKILGNEDNFIPVNADVVLFGLDNDDDGFLYIVKTVIQEKPEP